MKPVWMVALTCVVLAAPLSELLVHVGFVSGNSVAQGLPVSEAPAGFDNQTNGMVDQATHDQDRKGFEEVEADGDGVGPVFNARSCAECHGNPITGGGNQVAELRAGHFDGVSFIEHSGGSLIQSRAIDASLQERVLEGNEVRTLRMSLGLLGDGFVEAIDDNTLIMIAKQQPLQSQGRIAGQIVWVPIVESPGSVRVGRFGWKNAHASLLSFAGDAYRNEMGITTPLFPEEDLSNGRPVKPFDPFPDPEEGDNDDLEAFARFIRATKAPPRDLQLAATPEAQVGAHIFNSLGCAICHVTTLTTLPAPFVINGGTFAVPAALGSKLIHPYSDFLLHNIGPGDGIVQNGGPETRNKVRTAPLWGLRTRNRLMHDGASLTLDEAILRHDGEADFVTTAYRALSQDQKKQLVQFLNSL